MFELQASEVFDSYTLFSFVSKGWGGRVSNQCLTEMCGLLNYLEPGDFSVG